MKRLLFLISLVLISSVHAMEHNNSVSAASSQNTFVCPICYEPKSEYETYRLPCGHTFCKACLTHVIDAAINERAIAQLKCPNENCNRPLNRDDVKNIMRDPAKLETFDDIQTQEWLVRHPNARHCPTPDCPYAFLADKRCPQTIRCPSCSHEYCSHCLLHHPVDMTCQHARNTLDRASEDWKHANTKLCPQCGAAIQKNGGCPLMTCRCGQEFQWDSDAQPLEPLALVPYHAPQSDLAWLVEHPLTALTIATIFVALKFTFSNINYPQQNMPRPHRPTNSMDNIYAYLSFM